MAAFCAALLTASGSAFAAAGDLDSGFGSSGITVTAVGSGDDSGARLALQADGKIVVTGTTYNGSDNDVLLLRYDTAGALDAGFGTAGVVVTAVGSGDDSGGGVVVQPDGKILVAGRTFNGSDNDFLLLRYEDDGTLDGSFGSGGIVTTPIGSDLDEAVNLALQPDGKIVLLGISENGSDSDFALARYDDDGTLDGSFGSGGIVTTPIGSGDDTAFSLALQSDGKIVVVGAYDAGGGNQAVVVRYDTAGALDATFGSGGIAAPGIGLVSFAIGVALQADGKIVVAGGAFAGISLDFTVSRFDTFGALDPGFGSGGVTTTALGTGTDLGIAAAVQGDGAIVVAGSTTVASQTEFALARYDSSGTLDGTFGSGGITVTAVGPGNDQLIGLALEPGGKIVVSGSTESGGTNDVCVARYEGTTVPVCGNGALEGSEVCDDGNTDAGDCCSPTCTYDAIGSACADDGEGCTADECDGAGACTHPLRAVGVVCRVGSGDLCDPAETCDGVATACPVDVVSAAGTVCNPGSGDLCDPDETCSGVASAACPGDTVAAAGSVCNPGSGDLCDPDETCSGVADTPCPTDSVATAGTVCNPGSGDLCDPDETCSGVADAPCPADTVAAPGTVCNSGSDDLCDPDETCGGVADTPCPADTVAPASTVCRDAIGECDAAELCPGSPDGACPANAPAADGAPCAGTGSCQSGTCVVYTPPENFTCWKVKDVGDPRFAPGDVDLTDAFATQTAELKKPFLLCAPADANGGTATNVSDHLCCYKAKGAKFANPRPEVEAVGQTLAQTLDFAVVKTFLYCEPCTTSPLP